MRRFVRRSLVKNSPQKAFTIVELLVVIVVIAILATISFVAYVGISQKAKVASLQHDLDNGAKEIELYKAENGAYPNIVTDCPNPVSGNICIKFSSGNSYVGYSADNLSNTKTFTLIASNNSGVYKITNSSAATQLASTTQPGVTPGAVLELHAAKANGGSGPGINSPLTTTWADTSGNGNNGTLTNFAGSPWSGVGTSSNPYGLVFDAATTCTVSYAPTNTFSTPGNMIGTAEMWVMKPVSDFANTRVFWREWGPTSNEASSLVINGNTGQGRLVIRTETTQYNIGSIGPNLGDGYWHHLVGVVNGTTGYFYADGALIAQQALPPGTLITTKGNVGYANGGYLVGSVTVMRIYPFSLTASQVTTNYNTGPDW